MVNYFRIWVVNYFGFAWSISVDYTQKTPRVRFEAIAVGVNLALRQNPNLVPKSVSFLESKEFIHLVTGGSHNTPSNVRAKIEFVRDKLIA